MYEETSKFSEHQNYYESRSLETCQSEGVYTLSSQQEGEGSES